MGIQEFRRAIMGVQEFPGISASDYGCPRISRAIMGVQEFPQESPGIPSGKELVSFGDLERVVCSSIGHLRPRIREPKGGSAPASVSEFAKRFDGCPAVHPAIHSNPDLMGVQEFQVSRNFTVLGI